MAEKETVSRSQAIRDYLKSVKSSERSPRAVSEALKAKGINVSPGLVSQVKSALSNKSKKLKRKLIKMAKKGNRRPRRHDAAFNKKIRKMHPDWFSGKKTNWFSGKKTNFDTLMVAKNLLNSLGGDLSEAKKSLEIVSRLLS